MAWHSKLLRRRRWLLLAGTALLALLLYLDWPRIGAYWLITSNRSQVQEIPGARLSSYVVTIEAQAVEGLKRNASGLSYNSMTGSLFAVINRPAAVVELDLHGRLLRHIPLPWLSDPEGITHVRGELFIISDESSHDLHWIRIPNDTQVAQDAGQSPLLLDYRQWYNMGLEGVSWDEKRNLLLLANEKWPRKIFLAHALTQPASQPGTWHVEAWQPSAWLGYLGRDLASLTTHPVTGSLLVLSEQSRLVTEYSREGKITGVLPLWRGFAGLQKTIPQPEGMAMGPDGVLYILSEPNLFYRLNPAKGSVPGSVARVQRSTWK